jgi:transcriptional regulator of acetoin/glycerol metabolism
MLQQWKQFVQTGSAEKVRKDILCSWTRCREQGLDPFRENYPAVLPASRLEASVSVHGDLLEAANQVLEPMQGLFDRSGVVCGVLDPSGLVLHLLGSERLLKVFSGVQVAVGSQMIESLTGTTGPTLAMATGIPVSVCGPEHYSRCYHWANCFSSPIRDSGQNIVGCLNFSSAHGAQGDKVAPYLFGLLVQTVKSIEVHLRIRELVATFQHLFRSSVSLPELTSQGILLVDGKGTVLLCNDQAESILGLKPFEGSGQDIRRILPDSLVLERILRGQSHEERVPIQVHKGTQHYSIVAERIPTASGSAANTLISIRPAGKCWPGPTGGIGHVARYTFEDILGKSPPLLDVVRRARIASKSNLTILLEGETGTGKELLAQAIHNDSLRRSRPFVAINCSAIPRELVESELFGYVGGAFTGSRKEGSFGKFEIAEGGTLFLDEVNTLAPDIQAKLLRVLENRQIVRVGDVQVRNIDVRIIASSSVSLEGLVGEGAFRSDLFYRLNVFKIDVPPLRERKEDIQVIAEALLDHLHQRQNAPRRKLSREALDLLLAHDWPGNVRELRNCLEYSLSVSSGEEIHVHDLPEYLLGGSRKSQKPLEKVSFREMEKLALTTALRDAEGDVQQAARMLGVSRATLYRKLKKHHVSLHKTWGVCSGN